MQSVSPEAIMQLEAEPVSGKEVVQHRARLPWYLYCWIGVLGAAVVLVENIKHGSPAEGFWWLENDNWINELWYVSQLSLLIAGGRFLTEKRIFQEYGRGEIVGGYLGLGMLQVPGVLGIIVDSLGAKWLAIAGIIWAGAQAVVASLRENVCNPKDQEARSKREPVRASILSLAVVLISPILILSALTTSSSTQSLPKAHSMVVPPPDPSEAQGSLDGAK